MSVAVVLLLLVVAVASMPLWWRRPSSSGLRDLSALGLAILLVVAGAVAAASSGSMTGWREVLLGAAAVLAAAGGGGPVAETVLRRASRGAAPAIDPGAGSQALRGGAWIGVLERVGVCAAVLVGSPEGVAVVVAVKGLGRYPELRHPGASERFIIGTLASLLWAAGAAGVALLAR